MPVHLPILGQTKPIRRAECLPPGWNAARPCLWRDCRYHLEDDKGTCTLDVADLGGLTLEEIGEFFGLTRERIRQIEQEAIRKLSVRLPAWLAYVSAEESDLLS